MSEPKPDYNTQPDDCHAHSHDDNHGVEFWRRAPVTDAQYRLVLAERAILQEQVKELQAYADKLAAGLPVGMLPQDVENLRRANEQFAVDVDALTLKVREMRGHMSAMVAIHDAHETYSPRNFDRAADIFRAYLAGEDVPSNDGSFEQAFTAQMMAIHAVNTGNGFSTGDREFQEKLIEEVNEVFEETANNGIDGDLVNELADVCIAIMFYCAGNNLPLAAAIEAKNLHNKTRGWKHGKVTE